MSETFATPPTKRLYGRSRSRTWGRSQDATLMETLYPTVAIALERASDPSSFFETAGRSLWLEIGFGHGEHVLTLAEQHPERCYLAAEGYLSGVAYALKGMQERQLSNLRFYAGDARILLAHLGDETLDGVFLLFSDPWPKARHHKRRVFQDDVRDQITRVCRSGAIFRFASDALDYAAAVAESMAEPRPKETWLSTLDSTEGGRPDPTQWPETRYEQKARRAGKAIRYLEYRKR